MKPYYKDKNRTEKKERRAGAKKSSSGKSYLSLKIMIILLLIIGIGLTYIYIRFKGANLPEKTKTEMQEISNSLNKWRTEYGSFPENLDKLTLGRPMRNQWINDSWNKPYKYAVGDSGNSFIILSAGADGIFNNQDDLKIKYPN